MNQQPVQPRRFTVLSVFKLTFVIALILGIAVSQWRYFVLWREVQLLRAEVGKLVIVDESKVNVVQVPNPDPYTWQWRVYVPEGMNLDAGIKTSDIPPGFDAPAPTIKGLHLPSVRIGVLMTASVKHDLNDGYRINVSYMQGSFGNRTQLPQNEFLDGSFTSDTAGEQETEVFGEGEPIILHRRRIIPDKGVLKADASSQGFMIWLVPRKEK